MNLVHKQDLRVSVWNVDEPVMLFVGAQALKGNTSIKAMVCPEMDVTGPTYDLKPGFNLIVSDEKGHLFIDYRITSVGTRLATVPFHPPFTLKADVSMVISTSHADTPTRTLKIWLEPYSKIPLST